MKLPSYYIKRALRIGAFALAAGWLFMGAGNALGMSALQSAALGALGAVGGLLAALALVYAVKGLVSDSDFNAAISNSVQQLESKTTKEK